MAITRQIFEFNDTGTAGDTGPATFGAVKQMRWNPDAGDTGADLQIAMLPKMGDTGDGFLILNDPNSLGSDFVVSPHQSRHDTSGDALTTDVGRPFIAAGDRLRVKVINQAGVSAPTQGRLYVYIDGDE